MVGYCATTDLLMGEIPLPSYVDPQKYVDDAKDEIDSYVGNLYATPLTMDESGPMARPARLLIKRINAHLATGRLILAIASPEENKNLHAYGYSLVAESIAALNAIAAGEVTLDGAPPASDAPDKPAATVPMISNLDAESNVEAFYNRIANPYVAYPGAYGYTNPDRIVP